MVMLLSASGHYYWLTTKPFSPLPLQNETYDEGRGPSIDQLVSQEDVDSLKYMGWEEELQAVVEEKVCERRP